MDNQEAINWFETKLAVNAKLGFEGLHNDTARLAIKALQGQTDKDQQIAILEKALSDINDIAVEWHECGPYENANDRALEMMMRIYKLSSYPSNQKEVDYEQ